MSAIKAEHKLWAEFLFNFYIQRLLNNNFSGFYHLGEIPVQNNDEKIIITPNHFSWWDGFFAYRFIKKFFPQKKLHMLMLESQLKRYWFFSKVGAYSIDPENPKKIIGTINYTAEILRDSGNLVVIYPQGEIEPQDTETLNLKKGIVKVLEKAGEAITVLPVAFRIIFGNEMKPTVVSTCGQMYQSDEITGKFGSYSAEMNRANRSLSGLKYENIKTGIKY